MRLRCISVSPSAGACIVFPALCTGAYASCLTSLPIPLHPFHSFTEPRRRSRRAARRRGPRERRGGVDQVHRGGEPRDHEPPRQECDHDAPRGPHDRCDADPSAMGECSEKDDGRRGRRKEGEGAQWRKRMGVRHVSPVKLHAMCGLFCGSTRRTRRARAHQTTRQLSPPTNAMSISKHRRYPTPIPHTIMLPPPTGRYLCAGAVGPVPISRFSPSPPPPPPSSSRSRTAVLTACGSSSPVPRAGNGVPKVRIGGVGARREDGWARTERGRRELITIPHNS